MRSTFVSIIRGFALLIGGASSDVVLAADGVNEAKFMNDGEVAIPDN